MDIERAMGTQLRIEYVGGAEWGGGRFTLIWLGRFFFLQFDVHADGRPSMSQIDLAEAALLGRTRRRDLHRWQPSHPYNSTL